MPRKPTAGRPSGRLGGHAGIRSMSGPVAAAPSLRCAPAREPPAPAASGATPVGWPLPGRVRWSACHGAPDPGESAAGTTETTAVRKVGARGSPSRRFLRRGGVPIPPPRHAWFVGRSGNRAQAPPYRLRVRRSSTAICAGALMLPGRAEPSSSTGCRAECSAPVLLGRRSERDVARGGRAGSPAILMASRSAATLVTCARSCPCGSSCLR